jgi:hypothetical protein
VSGKVEKFERVISMVITSSIFNTSKTGTFRQLELKWENAKRKKPIIKV